ncbi:hypothetical protein AAHC03_017130 [Spirometra sp. Aus1]
MSDSLQKLSANRTSAARRKLRHQYTGSFSKVFNADKFAPEDQCNVITELREAELRGKQAPDRVLSYMGQKQIPNDVLWVLDSRHDMYCGIFDATGDQFFSASQDGIVRIFDYTGRYFRLRREIICHDFGWSIVSLVQSPDQRQLAFCSLCAKLNLVNLDDETSQIRVFHLANDMGASDVFSLSFCGFDSTKLICGRNRGRLTLCNLETGTCEELDASPRPGADINAVATLDDSGDTFVAGGDDTCIRMFDARALNEGCLASFPGHVDGITYIDSKNDGRYFLSNSKDQTVRLWDVRVHCKAGGERRTKPREAWDYRIHQVPQSYTKRPPNDRQSRSVLTLTGHTVRYTLIRAKFSPAHSTGQRFAYSGSAWGDWHIWDLCTGKVVSRNFVKAVTLRDVHWHPWDTRVVTSGLNGSLTCWGYRKNQAKRKPLLFTRRTSANVTPPIIADAVGGQRADADDGDAGAQDEDEAESMDEQSRYYQSESGRLNYRVCLNRAGFSYRFPRRRPVPAVSYTEVVSDVSTTTTTTTSSDEEEEEDDEEDGSPVGRRRHPRRTLSSSRGAATYLEDVSFYESEDEDSEDDPDFYPYDWSMESPDDGLYGDQDADGGLDEGDERFLPTPLHAFYARYLESGPVDGDPPRTRSQSRRLASASSSDNRSQPRGRGNPRSSQRHRSHNNPR